jgi:hypothetical protein
LRIYNGGGLAARLPGLAVFSRARGTDRVWRGETAPKLVLPNLAAAETK